MFEEKFESLKREYLKTKAPDYLANYGWANVESRLGGKVGQIVRLPRTRAIAFAFASIVIVLISILALSQKSNPGGNLYPLKIASDKIVAKITGDYEASIEKRAQEVINSSTDPTDNIDEATRQYQQALEEAEKEAEKRGKGQELRNTLDEQEEKFRQSQRDNPASQNKLEEAIKHTEQSKGEVQGQKDEHPQPVNNGQNNSNGQQNQKGKNK